MSQSIRQSNLFAGEDFTKAYLAFKNVDFQAYDFDTIKSALVEYIRTYYPEDFNDYVESSEFIAIIELLAYLGTSLSFRVDLNSRENFLDTAQRRESIIRLARMLSYQPKRNIATQGLLKISAVRTTERVLDSLGQNLSNVTIAWEDPNNDAAYEQFVAILNSAFSSSNVFGRPFKKGKVNNIDTQLYKINTTPSSNIAYSVSALSNGKSYPVDIVNVDFDDGIAFKERHPDPAEPFHVVYRNDSNGLTSPDTGFFVYFKQGELSNEDFVYDQPIENRLQELANTNINNQDVYVQKVDELGNVLEKWTQVPALTGNNIAYNDLDTDVKKIYSVISGLDDTVTLKFSDGNFGEVPKGLFRVWTRRSANQKVVFKPEEFTDKTINIPYIGKDNREYILTLTLSLETTVANGEPSETTEDIRKNAPQVFYTQNRMVNREDYNTFPLTRGNEIAKLRTINRTYAGHSRYIDVNDPTGTHSDLIIDAEDGAIYKELDRTRDSIEMNAGVISDTVANFVESKIKEQKLIQFFYDEYLGLVPPITLSATWAQDPSSSNINIEQGTTGVLNGVNISPNTHVTNGARIKFKNPLNPDDFVWVNVVSVLDSPNDVNVLGPLTLSTKVPYGYEVDEIIPTLRPKLTDLEKEQLVEKIENENNFGMVYDYTTSDWTFIDNPDINDTFDNINDWMLYIEYEVSDNINFPIYNVYTRGVKYIFESKSEVRFFFDPDQQIFDIMSGKSLQDEIIISALNDYTKTETWTYTASGWELNGVAPLAGNQLVLASRDISLNDIDYQATGSTTIDTVVNGVATTIGQTIGDTLTIVYKSSAKVGQDVKWNIKDVFVQPDGYVDQRKVEIKLVDLDKDKTPEVPNSFNLLVNQAVDRVYFERFTDFDGYEYFRVWHGLFVDSDGTVTEVNGNLIISNENVEDIDLIRLTVPNATFLANLNSGTFYDDYRFNANVLGTVVRSTNGTYYTIIDDGSAFALAEDNSHYERIGKSFVNQYNGAEGIYKYKWKHFAPSVNRIDPSISNIHDMLVLTQSYYNDILIWKEESGLASIMPSPPTTHELRAQFGELDKFKMMSDQIVFKSGKFKVLFGPQAAEELRARFKVVKLPNAVLSDNEIKSGVINAIDEFFDIKNWDFGESFYYTELAAYIHSRMQNSVASVIIVPTDAESEFGNLFQIQANANELFLSTAKVDQVDIVRSLTETNLRVK